MTEKQKRFAECYAACANATEAAKMAGYSAKTARSQGQRLLTNDDIAQYIEELQEKSAGDRIVTIEQVKAFWSAIMKNPEEKTENRLKASEMLAKAGGVFLAKIASEANKQPCDVFIYLPEKRPIDE